jgi:hypothetical protein
MLVAAGGGGDALAAVIVHRALTGPAGQVVIATYAWDRLAIDPLPGPRSVTDFEGLRPFGSRAYAIEGASRARSPSGSTLPRLAGELAPATLVLLEATGGATGMRDQLRDIVATSRAEHVTVVDVGGDVLARGDEPTLRSPLADGLVLAACSGLVVHCELLVAGPGLDGELSEADVMGAEGVEVIGRLTRADIEPFAASLDWHPSEATALLAAAARGVRGRVEIRDRGLPVALTDTSPAILRIGLADALRRNRLARGLVDTAGLAEAERITWDTCGRSELHHERSKAERLTTAARVPGAAIESAVRAFEGDARSRGIDLVTTRRVAEATSIPIGLVRHHLEETRRHRRRWPLWATGG